VRQADAAVYRVIRVFPRRTAMTPTDSMVFVGVLPREKIDCDEVHVSCVFTWDITEAERLAAVYRRHYPVVKVGGPAYGDRASATFTPGMYVQHGVTFWSRGCPNRCPGCLVRSNLVELPIQPGNIIQDDNVLANRRAHIEAGFQMLKTQHAIQFTGGLEAARLKDWHVELLRSIRLNQLFTAYDRVEQAKAVERALTMLIRAGLPRRKLRCYVLAGREGDTIEAADARAEQVWAWGGMPFMQLWIGENGKPPTDKAWRRLQRKWARPAAMFATHKQGV